MTRLRVGRVALIGLAGWISSGAGQQPPPPIFRSSVEIVTIDVSVFDKDRRPVRGLSAEDFRVTENGKPLRIATFKAIDVADRLVYPAAWMREIAPDVVSNTTTPDRIVVIVLDDFLTSREPVDMETARQLGRAVIDQLGPADVAAVVYTLNHENGQDFTNDRERLLASVNRFVAAGGAPPGACPHNECVTTAFRAIAHVLQQAWPGRRKTIAYISPEGHYSVGPRNVEYGSFEANAAIWNSEPDLAATFQALQRANVNVYQYDTRGLKDSLDVMGGGIGMFADHTGGQTVTRTNDPLSRVPEMFAENNSYYLLGIEPAPPLPKGEMHPIKITLARPDLSVRARTGYFDLGAAPPLFKEKPPKEVASALDKAMEGTVPKSDIPMGLMVAPFAVASPNVATVAIVAGLDRPASLSERDTVEIAARAFDVKDALRGSKGVATAKLELTRRPQASGAVHYDVATRLDLPPGRYEIRLAMTSDVLRLSGSAFTTVIVPAFAKEPLSMSGVVLGRVPFSKARGRDPLNGLLPFTPTTSRTFSTSDRVAAYVRVYLAGGNMAKAASVVTRIRDRADRAVVEEKTTSLVDGATMTARMVEHRFDLPLSRLQPGEYLLSIEASTGQPAAARHVRFTVE